VLSFEFKGFQGRYRDSLPDAVPVLAQHESFARLLARATHRDPGRRFASAGEMAGQLTGVLREVLALADGTPRPAFSATFSPEVQVAGASLDGTAQALAVPSKAEVVAGLPLPLVERADPAAGYLATFAGLSPEQRIAALTLAAAGDPSIPAPVTVSAETRLALVRARIDAGDYDGAASLLADLAAGDPVDRSCVSAAFGLARTCLATGDWPGDIAALAAVPVTSSHHAAAQIAAVRIPVARGPGQGVQVSGDDLRQADGRLGQLGVDDRRREQLTVEILRAALDWCGTGQPAGKSPIAGCEPNPRALRFGLERSYRALARLTPDEDRRIELVDMANAIRPRTLT
jgi:serine/threonine-protein kinase PknG